MCVPRRSYGTGPLLTFRFRFRRESLPARKAGLQRVPPAEAVLAALPAQVRNLGPDARGEVDKAAAHVLEFASESVSLVYRRLDGTLEIGLLGKRIRVRVAVLRGSGDEAVAPVRLRVVDQVPQLAQPRERRVDPPEEVFESRDEGVRLRHREEAHGRVGMHAEIRRATHRDPRIFHRRRRRLPFAYVSRCAVRTARADATMFRSFAWASSTVRVLSPQSGSM